MQLKKKKKKKKKKYAFVVSHKPNKSNKNNARGRINCKGPEIINK